MEWLIPVVAGFVIGVLIGLTGMGGGALTTPFLVIVMRMHPVAAVGADLAFAAITKMVGGAQHLRQANVVPRWVAWMALGSIPAALLGVQITLRLGASTDTTPLLTRLLGAVLLLVSAIFLARTLGWRKPVSAETPRHPTPLRLIAVGATGGLLVGITSIGGGTIIMALLLIFFALPINQMVGLDVVHGALLATVAAAFYAVAGQTAWPIVFTLLLGSLPGVWLGARALNRIDERVSRSLVAVLVLAAGVHLLLTA